MTKKTKVKSQKRAEEDADLDEALVETYPASDPFSMTQPRTGADVPQRYPKGEVPPGRQSRRLHLNRCAAHVIDVARFRPNTGSQFSQ